jgi:hypothetical protein
MEYKDFNSLKGKTLQYGDSVVFFSNIVYSVRTYYLTLVGGFNNSKIFKKLGIDEYKLATECYGYIPNSGEWPECRGEDYPALTRLVLGLFKIIEGRSDCTPNDKMVTKKVFNVLILDKKTGKVIKNETLTAVSEQESLLKTFGVNPENAFIKVTELGSFEEEKPMNAIVVKEK